MIQVYLRKRRPKARFHREDISFCGRKMIIYEEDAKRGGGISLVRLPKASDKGNRA